MCKDKTRVLITHVLDFLHLTDRIAIMQNGKMIACGTYEELKSNAE